MGANEQIKFIEASLAREALLEKLRAQKVPPARLLKTINGTRWRHDWVSERDIQTLLFGKPYEPFDHALASAAYRVLEDMALSPQPLPSPTATTTASPPPTPLRPTVMIDIRPLQAPLRQAFKQGGITAQDIHTRLEPSLKRRLSASGLREWFHNTMVIEVMRQDLEAVLNTAIMVLQEDPKPVL